MSDLETPEADMIRDQDSVAAARATLRPEESRPGLDLDNPARPLTPRWILWYGTPVDANRPAMRKARSQRSIGFSVPAAANLPRGRAGIMTVPLAARRPDRSAQNRVP